MNTSDNDISKLPIFKYRGYIGILHYGYEDNRIYGSIANEKTPECISETCFAGDNLEEAEEWFQSSVRRAISVSEYKLKNENWKHSVDIQSISAAYNILPEVFLERINKGMFDESLLKSTVGGDYEVPLYYVTKAWDYILNGSLCGLSFMIDIGVENPNDEDIKEFILEMNPIRFREEAITLNNKMKEIWLDKFGIDINKLNVDFSIFNKNLYPQVSWADEYDYFSNVPDGVDEWILSPVIYPDINYIFYDVVSCLMEFAAKITRERQNEGWNPWD